MIKIDELKGLNVYVGIPAKSNKTHNDDGVTLAELAMVHEFGSPTNEIPERSFLRKPFFDKKAEISAFAKNQIALALVGRTTAKEALGLVGERARDIAKMAITEGVEPELKPKTIKRKGSSKPLIDTGQLLNSIDYEVRK